MEKEDNLPMLATAMARYPLRIYHPAGMTVLNGFDPHGRLALEAARRTLFTARAQFSCLPPSRHDECSEISPQELSLTRSSTLPTWRDVNSPFRFVKDARVHKSLLRADAPLTNSTSEVFPPCEACCPAWSMADYAAHNEPRPRRRARRARSATPTAGTATTTTTTTMHITQEELPAASARTSLHPSQAKPTQGSHTTITTVEARRKRARHDDTSCTARLPAYDALVSRVEDNDDLLRDLLGDVIAETASPQPEASASAAATAAAAVREKEAQPLPSTAHTVRAPIESLPSPHRTHPPQLHAAVTERGASATPPRTTFRYCSSNSRTSPSVSPGAPVEDDITKVDKPLTTASPHPVVARVPAFPAFIEACQSREKHTIAARGDGVASLKREAKQQEAAVQSAMAKISWKLLVDHRERVKGKHEFMLAALARQQVPCAPCALPCGDFAVSVAIPPPQQPSSSTMEPADEKELNMAPEAPPTTSSAPLGSPLPHLFSLIVERKTADDLDASIKGSRYLEQRRLLSLSPFTHVIWLVEGEPHTWSRRPGPGSRTPSPPPPPSSHGAAAEGVNTSRATCARPPAKEELGVGEVHQRLDAACASLSLFCGDRPRSHVCDGVPASPLSAASGTATTTTKRFSVVRTRDVHESISFLKQLALVCVREAAIAWGVAPMTTCAMRWKGPPVLPTGAVFDAVGQLQRRLRAQTSFPRALMCIRGCSSQLALWITNKYGTPLALWRLLQAGGRAVVDEDAEVRQLPVSQKKVLILLTEFLLATEYY